MPLRLAGQDAGHFGFRDIGDIDHDIGHLALGGASRPFP